jgi:superfamily II DNA/RNA helicase
LILSWKFLPKAFQASLTKLEFHKPTPVQVLALKPALEGEDLILLAPTGTGKTLVYLLPLWQLMVEKAKGNALVLVPTRELAYQVSQMLQQLNSELRDHIVVLVGGHADEPQVKALRGPWRILIATPGRLRDHLDRRPDLLASTRLLILDEFDRLVDMGFEDEVGSLVKAIPKSSQRLLLSATPQDESLSRLGFQDLRTITVERELGDHHLSEQFYLLKTSKTKAKILLDSLAELAPGEQALIFVNNIAKANHLHGLLKLRGLDPGILHGHQIQIKRADVFQKYRDGVLKILVATDLAARGFDIPEVALIVNYDIPHNVKQYVHRSGRTARRGRDGVCLSFAGPEDWLAMRNMKEGRPEGLPYHEKYNQEETWFRHAKRIHDTTVRRDQKADQIRSEQGISESEET